MLHQYAEDCQICIATPVSDASPIVIRLQECLCQVDAWMSSSRLQLNHKKTEEMWLGSRQQLDKLSVQQVMVVSSPVTVSSHARDLGVIIDSQLSLSGHVNALCQSCYYQLRPVISSKSEDVVRTLVHAFVSCRLDYCNSLFFGMTDDLFQRLQGIQNAAARLVTGTSRREHITTVLRRLHWLPVRQRTEFKLALLIHKSWLGQLPPYLADDCRHTLRSSDTAMFVVRRTNSTFGDRSFAVAGARIWNSLPSSLRSADLSTEWFEQALKMFLFVWDRGATVTFCLRCARYKFSDIHTLTITLDKNILSQLKHQHASYFGKHYPVACSRHSSRQYLIQVNLLVTIDAEVMIENKSGIFHSETWCTK